MAADDTQSQQLSALESVRLMRRLISFALQVEGNAPLKIFILCLVLP